MLSLIRRVNYRQTIANKCNIHDTVKISNTTKNCIVCETNDQCNAIKYCCKNNTYYKVGYDVNGYLDFGYAYIPLYKSNTNQSQIQYLAQHYYDIDFYMKDGV